MAAIVLLVLLEASPIMLWHTDTNRGACMAYNGACSNSPSTRALTRVHRDAPQRRWWYVGRCGMSQDGNGWSRSVIALPALPPRGLRAFLTTGVCPPPQPILLRATQLCMPHLSGGHRQRHPGRRIEKMAKGCMRAQLPCICNHATAASKWRSRPPQRSTHHSVLLELANFGRRRSLRIHRRCCCVVVSHHPFAVGDMQH